MKKDKSLNIKFLLGLYQLSPDSQMQDFKCFGICNSPFSHNSLIKKKHEEILESASNNYNPVIIEAYYFGYLVSTGLSNSPMLLVELKVSKHERKLPISM